MNDSDPNNPQLIFLYFEVKNATIAMTKVHTGWFKKSGDPLRFFLRAHLACSGSMGIWSLVKKWKWSPLN